MMTAVRAYAALGEITQTLKAVYGIYTREKVKRDESFTRMGNAVTINS